MAGRSSDFAPYFGASAVTANDSTVIPTSRALYVGVTGDVTARLAQGQTVTFKAAPVGVLPVQVDKVLSTGTTATNILALY
ncbi:spike base protein, RCAP_Rcc01079 family [Sphingobium chungbukense]|uniref:Uncharacterized protein n=1 Tax=Sphingobium chungbukense TaxID=56193 RepID=A0A0M3AUW0_9SPHN|nr:hypothetical protein [Sphingobium chungbukense]KKW92681.1 hypothetical protein YP76_07035 [Sphingobium chungbukense]